MKCFLFLAVAVLSLSATAAVKPLVVTGAPFELTVAEWTPPARDFPITQYGAKSGGAINTAAFDAAIDAAAAAGGGRVVLPKGEWYTGGITLKSNVALVFEKDAILHFPDDPVVCYRAPLKPDGRPDRTRPALIYAEGATNIAVMGAGTIKCDVAYWHDHFNLNPKRGWPRPQLLQFNRCGCIRLEDFRVRGSPAWTIHLKVCDDIVMRGVDSVCTGPNTDGLDFESCNRALVENCSLDQTDDTYTIKSGSNEAGRARNIPTQNVVIRNCRSVHGHTLLGIGSEVSGGIRNIYMTNCEVVSECWRFLFVKTNCKRGAYVENVWLENIRGKKANQSVLEIEQYYDGNPNKELTKKGGTRYVTRIRGIHAKNVVCDEANWAVKVNGDEELPPVDVTAENIRVGRVKAALTKLKNAPDVKIENVREDAAATREILDLPAQVRMVDPAKDGDAQIVFSRAKLDELSLNAAVSRVLEARIAAEVAADRNVAPRLEPTDVAQTPYPYEFGNTRRLDRVFQGMSCAVPGAWIADDVRQVARADETGAQKKFPGVKLSLALDLDTVEATVTVVNAGKEPLRDVWGVFNTAPYWMTTRWTFRVPTIAPGETWKKVLSISAGAHYSPIPVDAAPYAVSLDFTQAGTRGRLWQTVYLPPPKTVRLPNDSARVLGPVPLECVGDDALAKLSAARGPLPDLGADARWTSPRFPEAAWYDVTGPSRPYTAEERKLVDAERGYEVVALQFHGVDRAKTSFRTTSTRWTKQTVAFLNGERIPIKSSIVEIPAKPGLNRIIVRYPCRKGDEKPCVQMSAYTWTCSLGAACEPFER